MTIDPLDATFGAVITDVRLAEIDDHTLSDLRDAWLEFALLVFPGQHLTHDEQIAFAERFGEIELIGGSKIVALSNVKPDGSLRDNDDMIKILVGNMGWHADSTYMPVQAKGAVFSADIVPEAGGETGWADMRAAYEALDADTKRRVGEMSAHHSLRYSQSKVGHAHSDESEYVGYGMDQEDAPLRPLVKFHPETGRPSLNIGRHAHAIPGMEPPESERFIADLIEQACMPPRTYHHQWQPGDVVLWDNRCLLHRARPWDMTEPRTMWHSRIAGSPASEHSLTA